MNRHTRPSLLAVVALICLSLANCAECAIVRVRIGGLDSNDGSTWELAKKTVTDALTAAVSGDEVWVAKGSYAERITLKNGVSLYGGFDGSETHRDARDWIANVTALGVQGGYIVTSPAGVTAATVMDGFTIKESSTGGIYCVDSSPTITHNTISNNSRGGISCSGSSATICDNVISGNRTSVGAYGGGINCSGGSPTILRNTIANNTASAGAGIYCTNAVVTISDNTISGNTTSGSGGGLRISNTSGTVENNRIVDNVADTGGGVHCTGCPLTLRNNTIARNVASYQSGAGVYSGYSDVNTIIANNTIVGNFSGRDGAGLYFDNCKADASNNIVAFNSSGIYKFGDTSTLTLRNNCVYNPGGTEYSGTSAGLGDISDDPRLVDLAYGDFHVQSESPCIGAGWNSAPGIGGVDIDGEPRIQPSDGNVDIGADESDGVARLPHNPHIVRVDGATGSDSNDGSDWTLAKKTVQAAIDAASAARGEVWVKSGVYEERITLKIFDYVYGGFAGSETSREERSWTTNRSILDGSRAGTVVTSSIPGRAFAIDGFTIRNGSGSGIRCIQSSPTIVHNTITLNSGADGGGVYCEGSCPVISNNIIYDNASRSGGGIYCSGAAIVSNNTVVANGARDGGGIFATAGWPCISNNILAFNSSGLYCDNVKIIPHNNCVYNPDGYNYSGRDGWGNKLRPGPGDISVDPQFAGLVNGDLHIQPTSPCRDAGWSQAPAVGETDIDGQLRTQPADGGVDIGADESDGTQWPAAALPVIRVDGASGSDSNDGSDWSYAKKTIQAAVDAIENSGVRGEVWVRAGTYGEALTLKSGSFLYGGFAGTESSREQRDWLLNVTALDGGTAAYAVAASNMGRTGAIDGFAVRGGTGGRIGCQKASPDISNNDISGAGTLNCGVGIYCSDASPRIYRNNIAGNVADGPGGGIYCSLSSPAILQNNIRGNSARTYGGAIYCRYSSAVISNNVITANSASAGAIYSEHSEGALCNNTIAHNSSPYGGAVHLLVSFTQVSNNLVAFNSTGIYEDDSSTGNHPTLRNNNVYNPAGYNYSGLSTGTGDISADPLFAGAGYGNYHIQPSSPCRNAGWNAAPGICTVDIDGQDRILPADGAVDIGADESDGTNWPAPVPLIVRVDGTNGSDANDGSDWTLAKKTIQSAIDLATAVGGEVWVKAGIYNERITLKPDAFLYGGFAGAELARDERDPAANRTIVDGGNNGSVVTALVGYNTHGIDGFTIRNGSNSGIYIATCSPTVSNNNIVGNTSTAYPIGGGGIYCSGSHSLITRNTFKGNSGSYGSGGITSNGSNPIISNNVFMANSGGAIYSSYGNVTIVNNTIAGCSGAGIYSKNSTAQISNNIVAFNSSGITVSGGSSTLRNNDVYNPDGANYTGATAGTGDISVDPQFADFPYGNLHIQPSSACKDAGWNDASGIGGYDIDGQARVFPAAGLVDIGADESDGTQWAPHPPTVIRVDGQSGSDAHDGSAWNLAKKTMQSAIDLAHDIGAEVWVRWGVYSERITLKPYSYVYGGFDGTESERDDRDWTVNETVIGGDGTGPLVNCVMGWGLWAIDGFTLDCQGSSGMNFSTCAGVVSHNRVVGYAGNGIYVNSCRLEISNNLIRGLAGGQTGKYLGSGIYCIKSIATVSNNLITCNNSGTYGGGIYCETSTPTISNNIIAANAAGTSGGGIYLSTSPAVVTNNTIVHNSSRNGGGIGTSSSNAVISNNIVAFNSSGISSGSTSTLRNNNVYNPDGYNYSGLSAGVGDISVDPMIADASYGNLHIQPGSPCIDAGWNEAPAMGDQDIDGQPRVQPAGGTVDIGADESDGTAWDLISPTIVRVDGGNGSDSNDGSSWNLAKKTVQSAIETASSAGGEVWVKAGVYNERISLKPYCYLYGGFAGDETTRDARDWAANPTIIDSGATGPVVSIYLGWRVCAVDGFTVRNGFGNRGGGISCSLSAPVISNNTIIGSSASYGGGICCTLSCPTISGNVVALNHAKYGGGGIYCEGGKVLLTNNTITNNSNESTAAGGAYFKSCTATVSNNIIAFNSSGISGSSSTVTMRNNDLHNPDGYNYSSVTAGTGDISADPKFVGWFYGDYRLQPDSPCRDAGWNGALAIGALDIDHQPRMQPSGGIVDIGADECDGRVRVAPEAGLVLRVDGATGNDANDGSTWTLAKKTVQSAIDTASAYAYGADVWVKAGLYKERIQMKPCAYVYGGFAGNETKRAARDWVANPTTLDGGKLGSVVTTPNTKTRMSIIDGFTISNGKAASGGGIYSKLSSPTISNCVCTGNTATQHGGGIYCESGSPTIARNTVTNNSSAQEGGGIKCHNCLYPVISGNTVTGNSSTRGGGLHCIGGSSKLFISGNIISGNTATVSGGGIHASPGQSPNTFSITLASNLICANNAGTGGGVTFDWSTNGSIVGNTIVGNTAPAGAVYCFSTTASVSNNIIAFNTSGIQTSGSTLTLRNNDVYHNTAFNYSGLTPGTGDISADPVFLGASTGNYHIAPDSPCRDAGYDGAVLPGWLDIDGQTRIQGPRVDIGADEWWPGVSDVKNAAEGIEIGLSAETVTAAFSDSFYVEKADRSSGVRVEMPNHGMVEGMRADISGNAHVNDDGEICIAATSVAQNGMGLIAPLFMNNSALGGGAFGRQDGVFGWMYAEDGTGKTVRTWGRVEGLNNIGLLVRTTGKVVEIDTAILPTWFKIDDGSGVNVKCLVPDGVAIDPGLQFVVVKGISSCEKVGDELHRLLRVSQQSDITGF